MLNSLVHSSGPTWIQRSIGPAIGEGVVPKPGSVIIADDFTPSARPSHGELVNSSLRSEAFRGQVYTLAQFGNSGSMRAQEMMASRQIKDPSSGPETITRALLRETETHAIGRLDSQTNLAHRAADSGTENSVLNFSWGSTKARRLEFIYNRASAAWSTEPMNAESRQEARTIAQNYANAFGLSMTNLTHCDPNIYGPERAKLQQNLSNIVDQGFSTSAVSEAKNHWATAVNRFESNRNSVVIAAGNEGEVGQRLAADAAGFRIQTPMDFTTNILENQDVTSVGSWTNATSRQTAAYSSISSGIDIYADGNAYHDNDCLPDSTGTSFAAPRVAAGMAELHQQFPKLSSSQIENLYRNRTSGFQT